MSSHPRTWSRSTSSQRRSSSCDQGRRSELPQKKHDLLLQGKVDCQGGSLPSQDWRTRGNGQSRDRRENTRRKGSFPKERWLRGSQVAVSALLLRCENGSQLLRGGGPNALLRGKDRDLIVLCSHPLKKSSFYPKAAL